MRYTFPFFLSFFCFVTVCLPAGIDSGENVSKKMLERIPEICRDVEAIRRLKFTRQVPVRVQTQTEFLQYVNKAIDKQFAHTDEDGLVNAWSCLGLLKERVNLRTVYLSLLQDQAAAHYDPAPGSKTYFLLATNAAPQMLDVISAHELCHALQDQHYDLGALIEGDLAYLSDNSDVALARQALVEGDATVVMTHWLLENEAEGLDPSHVATLASATLKAQALMSVEDVIRMTALAEANSSSGMEFSAEALAAAPRILVKQLLGAYLQGANMVEYVRERGGWAAVDALYHDPPTSTEQVLHPGKLLPPRDEPTPVDFSAALDVIGKDWVLKDVDVVGEMGLTAYFDLWAYAKHPVKTGRDASAGWDGDRYYYYENTATGGHSLFWGLVWDTPEDADEFVLAYRLSLVKRFGSLGSAVVSHTQNGYSVQLLQISKGRWIRIARKNADVGITDTTDARLVGLLWD